MTGRGGSVSEWAGGLGVLDDRQRAGIRRALARWRQHRAVVESEFARASDQAGDGEGGGRPRGEGPDWADPLGDRAIGLDVEIVDVELLHAGRPGVLDVVAEMDGRLAHAVLALRRPGDELHVVGPAEDPALGVVEDGDGTAVLVDALRDADAARLLLHAVAGPGIDRVPEPAGSTRQHPGNVITLLCDSPDATTLGIDRRFTISVFPWLHRGRHPGTAVLAGLDEAGFNHLPAPVALWRRAGRDLGSVQELVSGATDGWSVALASLRDLFASGVEPDAAGGDFASEALALGTMTARMHLALDRAFGSRPGDPAAWAEEAGRAATPPGASDGAVQAALDGLRACGTRTPSIRVHGDFHLGRTARTDHGWVLTDTMPGGTEPGSGEPVFRSPLADVAGLCASLRRTARLAAVERGPGRASAEVVQLASAWEARNRRAFLAAYLATPGIGGLVPANRELLSDLLTCFEVLATARHPLPAGAG